MKRYHFPQCILGAALLFAGISLACSLPSPAGLLGPSCTAQDGRFSAWTHSKTVLITFTVSGCKISQLILALNPAVSSKPGGRTDELFDIYPQETTTIHGNQFSLAMDQYGKISLEGTFTAPLEAEGTIQIAKGVHFQSNQTMAYQSFNQDFVDTWQGTSK
jgi:hypothetical protein